jgi:hypothetical protein
MLITPESEMRKTRLDRLEEMFDDIEKKVKKEANRREKKTGVYLLPNDYEDSQTTVFVKLKDMLKISSKETAAIIIIFAKRNEKLSYKSKESVENGKENEQQVFFVTYCTKRNCDDNVDFLYRVERDFDVFKNIEIKDDYSPTDEGNKTIDLLKKDLGDENLKQVKRLTWIK